MRSSKLFELLPLIKGSDRRDLLVFIEMSSNQLNEMDLAIGRFILEAKGKRKSIVEEKIFARFFKSHERDQWNKVKNRLTQVFLRYISMRLVEKSPYNDILQLHYLSERGLSKINDSLLKKALIKNEKLKHPEKPLFEYLLLERSINTRKHIRKSDPRFDKMENTLDVFYIEKKLRLLCERNNRNRIINSPKANGAFILQYIKDHQSRINSPKIEIYIFLLDIDNPKKGLDCYNKIRELLRKHTAILDDVFITEIIESLMNFTIRELNFGKTEYAHHYLEYLQNLIDRKQISAKKGMSHSRYKNGITANLVIGNVQEANNFLNRYKDFVDDHIKQDFYKFNKAQIEFYEGKHEACTQTLIAFKSPDIYYTIALNRLLLKLRCEEILQLKGDFHSFQVAIASQKKFINNQNELKSGRKQVFIKALWLIESVAKQKKVNLNKLIGVLPIMDVLWARKKIN